MKYFINTIIALALVFVASAQEIPTEKAIIRPTMTLTKEVLKDKIKGGWAGQTIGVTFGGPTNSGSTGL